MRTSFGLSCLLLASCFALPGCTSPPPPPAEGGEKAATPSEVKAAPGALGLRLQASREPSGPGSGLARITEQTTGLTLLFPRAGALKGTRFKLEEYALEVEFGLHKRPGADPLSGAVDLCARLGRKRAGRPVRAQIALPGQTRAWKVEGAASAVYALKGKAYDVEEVHVLVKGKHALVLYKRLLGSDVTPPLWTELNTSLNATLCWGGRRSPLAFKESPYVDMDMNLSKRGDRHARALAKRVSAAGGNAKSLAQTAQRLVRARVVTEVSEAPDLEISAQRRQVLVGFLGESLPKPVGALLAKEFTARVKTYRDLRALYLLVLRAQQVLA